MTTPPITPQEEAAFAAYIANHQRHLRTFVFNVAECVCQFVDKHVATDEVERVDIAAALYSALFPDLVAGEDPTLFPLLHFPPPFFVAVKALLSAACSEGVAVVLGAQKGSHAITIGRACEHCDPGAQEFAITTLEAMRALLDNRTDRKIVSHRKGQVH